MNRTSCTGMVSSMSEALAGHLTWQKCLAFVGGLGLLVFICGVQPLSSPKWLQAPGDHSMVVMTREAENSWKRWSTTEAEWQNKCMNQEGDPNCAGQKRLQDQRVHGSLWWDEKAEQYLISKLEASQFSDDCAKAHWIAHYDWPAGLVSSMHAFLLALYFAMVRGHTLVPVSGSHRLRAFDGCTQDLNTNKNNNMQCYFNITNCNPADDPSRLAKMRSPDMMNHDTLRTSWEELLMEKDEFFPQAGVTVVQTLKAWPAGWDTKVCVGSSSFSSFLEAYTYSKLNIWNGMGRHGKVGVVNGFDRRRKCAGEVVKQKRVDMVMTSILSSWMMKQVTDDVKLVADHIMSQYVDSSGRPLWRSPVLAIHIRQTDKKSEDPFYWQNGNFRQIEDFAVHMKKMEEEHGFQWPSIFILSDSGTALETLMTVINGNDSTAAGNSKSIQEGKRYIMYDWVADDHIQDVYKAHTNVPPSLKHNMQVHFLATLYILHKIADHAIVTYSSNVGRFIGEIMAAKHRVAFPDSEGPFVTSLDYPWYWN